MLSRPISSAVQSRAKGAVARAGGHGPSTRSGAGPASHASGKGVQQVACSFTSICAVFSSDVQHKGLEISASVVPPVSSVPP